MAASVERKQVKFELRAEPGSTVYAAGSFNDWNPTQKRMRDPFRQGLYSTTLLLPKGRHEYKFIVNGVWCVDPECQEWVPNSFGSLNSVVTVE